MNNFFNIVSSILSRANNTAGDLSPASIEPYIISLTEPVEGATFSEGQMITLSTDIAELPDPTNPLDFQETDILHFMAIGQSTAAGADSRPILSVQNVMGNLLVKPEEHNWFTYDPEGLDSLVLMEFPGNAPNTPDIHREGPGVGWVNGFKKGLQRELPNHPLNNSVTLLSTCTIGGSEIAPFLTKGPGTWYTDSFMKAVTAGADAAAKAGKSISCPAMLFQQGESEPDTRTYEQYLNDVLTLFNDMRTDAAAAYGHPDKLPTMFIYMPDTGTTAVKRVYETLIRTYNWIVGVGPIYQLPNVTIHLDPNGSRWLGEQYAKATIRMLKTNQKYQPLVIVKTEVKSNKVIITFNKNIVIHDLPMEWAGTLPSLFGVSSSVHSINRNQMILETGVMDLTQEGELLLDFAASKVRDADDYLSTTLYEDYVRLKPNTKDYKDENGNIIYGQPYPMFNWLLDYRGYKIQ